MSLIFSGLYAKCAYYFVRYVQNGLIPAHRQTSAAAISSIKPACRPPVRPLYLSLQRQNRVDRHILACLPHRAQQKCPSNHYMHCSSIIVRNTGNHMVGIKGAHRLARWVASSSGLPLTLVLPCRDTAPCSPAQFKRGLLPGSHPRSYSR